MVSVLAVVLLVAVVSAVAVVMLAYTGSNRIIDSAGNTGSW